MHETEIEQKTQIVLPLVSIILPIRNEEKYITNTLKSLKEQDYPTIQLQLVISDGRSEDNTRSIVDKFAEEHPQLSIKLINNPDRIFSTGFNLALDVAMGDIIIFLGGHTILHSDYVSLCVHYLATYPDIDCVGGTVNILSENALSQAVSLAMTHPFGMGGVAFRSVQGQVVKEVDTVPYGAYRREVFEHIGKLDIELVRNQDDEFNYRLRKANGRILLASDIQSQYFSRSSFRRLWRQFYDYGYWKVRVWQKHPSQMKIRHFIPALFVLVLLLGGLLAFLTVEFRLLWILGIIAYIIVDIYASVQCTWANGWQSALSLPFIFPILHIGYGAGFIVGLLKFWPKWLDLAREMDEKKAVI
jgi:succinoglycan biosynthesis protein ExoA